MKKIISVLAMVSTMLVTAQYGPQGWGNHYPQYGSYENNTYYFPDEYYYEYPNNYYTDNFYQDYYQDYRNSIVMINWPSFFRQNNLSTWQINMILDLNNQFGSFAVWNNYYRMNPHRWYYDRFYALERILGPQVFVVFQGYYGGHSPVVYYTNHWNNYYRPRYVVRPVYRNVNINVYKVNRNSYHKNVGNQYGWNQTRTMYNSSNGREITPVRTVENNSNRVINNRMNSETRQVVSEMPRNRSTSNVRTNENVRSNSVTRNTNTANGSIRTNSSMRSASSNVTNGTIRSNSTNHTGNRSESSRGGRGVLSR